MYFSGAGSRILERFFFAEHTPTFLLKLNKKQVFTPSPWSLESIQDWIRRFHIQLKDRLLSLINPMYLFFFPTVIWIGNKPTKIGHFQTSESIFEVKFQLNLPENDFLLRILN